MKKSLIFLSLLLIIVLALVSYYFIFFKQETSSVKNPLINLKITSFSCQEDKIILKYELLDGEYNKEIKDIYLLYEGDSSENSNFHGSISTEGIFPKNTSKTLNVRLGEQEFIIEKRHIENSPINAKLNEIDQISINVHIKKDSEVFQEENLQTDVKYCN